VSAVIPPPAPMFSDRLEDDDDLYIPQGIARDRFDRPMILQADGSRQPYTRASTMAKALDDGFGIGGWRARYAAQGVARWPDLQQSIAYLDLEDRDEKARADDVIEMAMDRAGANQKRERGTALHGITERLDRGLPISFVPPELRRAVTAYQLATEGIEWLAFEQFIVHDEYRVAGTADRFGKRADWRLPRVLDLKTGDMSYGGLSFPTQLAPYSSGCAYDGETETRTAFPFEVDQEVGVIIDLDADAGTCHLVEYDLQLGHRAVRAAMDVRELRKIGKRKVKPVAASTISQIFHAATLEDLTKVYDKTKPWTERERKAGDRRAYEIQSQESR